MAVITVSRQYGSGGDEVANRVCTALGYQFFDKRMIAQAAAEVGLSDQEILDYSDENHKVLSFLDQLFGRTNVVGQTRVWKEDVTGARTMETLAVNEDSAVTLVQKAIQSASKIDRVLIVGRAGQVILKDHPNVLHFRIESPLEERIQRVKEQLKQEKQEYSADIQLRREAQDLILQRDASSEDYVKRFYHENWNDPLLYHMIFNTGKMSIEQVVDIIVRFVRETEPAPAVQAS